MLDQKKKLQTVSKRINQFVVFFVIQALND
jgi:hypothetical protein